MSTLWDLRPVGTMGCYPLKNADVAPTPAALLGISIPNTDGGVLKEILTK
ncbi:MAG: hypothetical protein ACXWJB_09165 [Limisphaerales bacterium]